MSNQKKLLQIRFDNHSIDEAFSQSKKKSTQKRIHIFHVLCFFEKKIEGNNRKRKTNEGE